MQRIQHQWQAEAIAYGLSYLPWNIQDLVLEAHTFDFFCGDAIFAGLHSYTLGTLGRPNRETSHVIYQDDALCKPRERNTIVLAPYGHADWNFDAATVIHEVGHMIHWAYDLEDFGLPLVSSYAATSIQEAFAEAFCFWVWSDWPPYVETAFTGALDRDWMRWFDMICGD